MAQITVYAKNDSMNWNVADGWNTAADGSGSNVTNPQNGGGNTYICDCNGKTGVSINVDITVDKLHNSSSTAGGFTVNTTAASRQINCDVIGDGTVARGAALIAWTPSTSYTLTIRATNGTGTAEVKGGTVSNSTGIAIASGVGKFDFKANFTGGASTTTSAFSDNGTGASSGRTIVGNATGGSGSNSACGILITTSTADIVSFTGTITCGTGASPSAGISMSTGVTIVFGAGTKIVNYNGTAQGLAVGGSGGKIKWPSTDTNTQTVEFKDTSGTVHTLKVPDYPAESNVWYGSGTYDYGALTPSKRAHSIPVTNGAGATLSADDLKTGVICDDVTGDYDGGGNVIVIDD